MREAVTRSLPATCLALPHPGARASTWRGPRGLAHRAWLPMKRLSVRCAAAAGGELAFSGCPLAVAKPLVLLVEASGGVIYCPADCAPRNACRETGREGAWSRGEGHEKSRRQLDEGGRRPRGRPSRAYRLLALGHSRMRAKQGAPRREPGKAARPTADATGESPSGMWPLPSWW